MASHAAPHFQVFTLSSGQYTARASCVNGANDASCEADSADTERSTSDGAARADAANASAKEVAATTRIVNVDGDGDGVFVGVNGCRG